MEEKNITENKEQEVKEIPKPEPSRNPETVKKRELKYQIKVLYQEIQDLEKAIKEERKGKTKEELQGPRSDEEIAKNSQLAKAKGMFQIYTEELQILLMNKTGSEHFAWMPNKQMNRSQARNFRRNQRAIRKKKTNV